MHLYEKDPNDCWHSEIGLGLLGESSRVHVQWFISWTMALMYFSRFGSMPVTVWDMMHSVLPYYTLNVFWTHRQQHGLRCTCHFLIAQRGCTHHAGLKKTSVWPHQPLINHRLTTFWSSAVKQGFIRVLCFHAIVWLLAWMNGIYVYTDTCLVMLKLAF